MFVLATFVVGTFGGTFTALAQVPDAPVLDSASGGDSSVRLSWTAPKNSGGSAVSAYQIGYGTGGQTNNIINVGNVTTYNVTGLTNGTIYTFVVRARNASGFSADSNTLNGRPQASATVPGAPSTPTLTATQSAISVSWTAPSNNGGSAITSYTVGYTRSGQAEQTANVSAPTTTYQILNPVVGTSYSVRVRATNSVGSSPYSSSATITPAGNPGTPTGLEVTPGDGSLALTWNAASGNGSSVRNYQIYYQDQVTEEITEIDTNSASATYTITGLINGRDYIVKVRAENSIGFGEYSAEKLVSPDVNADPVLVGTPNVVPSERSAVITWTTNKTMSSMIDYGLIATAVSTSEYNTTSRVTEHTVTLSNLLPCTTYTYRVLSRDILNSTVTSTNKTFTTRGCPAQAEVLAVQKESVVVADGAIVDFTDSEIKARFDIPSEVTCLCENLTIQAKKLEKDAVQTSLGAPNRKNWIGEHVYNFTAYKDEDETVDQFDLPVDVTIEYTREDIEGINVDTLGIYHYDDSSNTWSTLTDCDNIYDPRTGTGTITCKTDSFSTFVLTSLQEDEIKKPSFRERLKNLFSRPFKKIGFKKFSRCGIENPN